MATDVILDQVDGTYLVLEARVVKIDASDFMLDATGRRKGGGPFRRALVHDQNDGLTINFAGDYPGGVTLTGVTEIFPKRPANLNPDSIPNLVVRGGISYETQGLNIRGEAVAITVVLDAELGKLQDMISQLTARVAALEARHP